MFFQKVVNLVKKRDVGETKKQKGEIGEINNDLEGMKKRDIN